MTPWIRDEFWKRDLIDERRTLNLRAQQNGRLLCKSASKEPCYFYRIFAKEAYLWINCSFPKRDLINERHILNMCAQQNSSLFGKRALLFVQGSFAKKAYLYIALFRKETSSMKDMSWICVHNKTVGSCVEEPLKRASLFEQDFFCKRSLFIHSLLFFRKETSSMRDVSSICVHNKTVGSCVKEPYYLYRALLQTKPIYTLLFSKRDLINERRIQSTACTAKQ